MRISKRINTVLAPFLGFMFPGDLFEGYDEGLDILNVQWREIEAGHEHYFSYSRHGKMVAAILVATILTWLEH